jgi:hypothetical protein
MAAVIHIYEFRSQQGRDLDREGADRQGLPDEFRSESGERVVRLAQPVSCVGTLERAFIEETRLALFSQRKTGCARGRLPKLGCDYVC